MSNSTKEYSKTATLNAMALGAFAICAALILGITYSATKQKIAESQRIAEEKALLEVLGDVAFDNDLLSDLVLLNNDQMSLLNLRSNQEHFARVVRLNGEIQGFILPAIAPDGYSGQINLILGVDTSSQIMGVRVVEHKETPGLGDKVDVKKSDWILGFKSLSLSNPESDNWAVKKDGGVFDAFTGATITPRAVVKMIKQTLELSETDMQLLIEGANDQTITNAQVIDSLDSVSMSVDAANSVER